MSEKLDPEQLKFCSLIKLALLKLEQLESKSLPAYAISSLVLTRKNLEVLSNTFLEGRLPRISKGEAPQEANLGFLREVSEWCDDDEVLNAMKALELYYRDTL